MTFPIVLIQFAKPLLESRLRRIQLWLPVPNIPILVLVSVSFRVLPCRMGTPWPGAGSVYAYTLLPFGTLWYILFDVLSLCLVFLDVLDVVLLIIIPIR